jgi:hypothetical protein
MSEDDITDDDIRRMAAKLGAPVPRLSSDAPPSPANTVYEFVMVDNYAWHLMRITDGKRKLIRQGYGYEERKRVGDALRAEGYRCP